MGGTFSLEKHLDEFFKCFVSGVSRLAHDLTQSWKSGVLCFRDSFFLKIFSFPSNFSDCSLSSLFTPFSNPPCFFTHKSTIFFNISTSIFKKRYGISYFLYVFLVYNLVFLDFLSWLLGFVLCVVSVVGWVFMLSLIIWVLLDLLIWYLIYLFIYLFFIYFFYLWWIPIVGLCILPVLCCA